MGAGPSVTVVCKNSNLISETLDSCVPQATSQPGTLYRNRMTSQETENTQQNDKITVI